MIAASGWYAPKEQDDARILQLDDERGHIILLKGLNVLQEY